MEIKTITIKRTVQIKQFEPLTVELTAEVLPDENAIDVGNQLRYKANSIIIGEINEEIDNTTSNIIDNTNYSELSKF